MSVILTSPVEGKDRGETYTGPREDWLVANGYAARTGEFDGVHATSVPAKDDPTLPENREAPVVTHGPDAYLEQDGQQILSFDTVEKGSERDVAVNPERYEPPLEHPTAHGTSDLYGTEVGEDKLAKKIHKAGERLVSDLDDDDPRRDTTPQAEDEAIAEHQPKADKQSEKAVKAGEKALDAAETDIPETSANTGTPLSESKVEKAHAEAVRKANAPADKDEATEGDDDEDGGQSNDGGPSEGGAPKQ